MNRVCRKKRMPALLLCLVLCLTTCLGIGTAAEWRDLSRQRGQAMRLQSLGLFLGVGEGSNGFTDFDLERSPSRAEAVTMLVRALGKDSEAKRLGTTHPFTDVPAWADGYVSYAYGQGLTRGTSDTTFGAWDPATGAMYMTFMLRALGYADGEDFTWDDPWTLAEACGILPLTVDRGDFRRADAVDVTAAALSARLKGTDSTLAQKLIAEGAFSQAAYDRAFQTYEAAMEEVAANAFYQEKERWESDYGTVLLGYVTGSPQSTGYTLCLVTRPAAALDEGLTITLPLANGQAPEQPVLSQDGQTFTYAIHLDEPLTLQTGMVCEAGTYAYTVDLSTGQVSGEAVPPDPAKLSPEEQQAAYDEAVAGIIAGNGFYVTVEDRLESELCTVIQTCTAGTSNGMYYSLDLVYKPGSAMGAGRILGLPLPRATPHTNAPAQELALSVDGRTLTYSHFFPEALISADGVTVDREKGTYCYTVDLTTGEVTMEVRS